MKPPCQTRASDHPEVFSRGALELSFRLLRKRNPALALEIQNVLVCGKLPCPKNDNQTNDRFHVNMGAHTVGKIIAALTEMGQQALLDDTGLRGRRVVIRTLIQEWMSLAEWIIIQAHQENLILH